MDAGSVVMNLRSNAERRFFEAVPQGGVVWDLGAHVGFYTLLAAKKAKYVLAIEPLAENAAYLDEHLRLNHILNVDVLKGQFATPAEPAAFLRVTAPPWARSQLPESLRCASLR